MAGGWLAVLILLTALGCGLVGGAFFAFSSFVMQGLARLPPKQGIAAMQAINVTAVTPVFMAALFGTGLACLVLMVIGLVQWRQPQAVWLALGAALYFFGNVVVTIVRNVPLNDRLAAADPVNPESAAFWTRYICRWVAWNHVRAVTAVAAAGCLTVAFSLQAIEP